MTPCATLKAGKRPVLRSAYSSGVIFHGSSALLLNLAQLSVALDSAYSSPSSPFSFQIDQLLRNSIHFAGFVNSACAPRSMVCGVQDPASKMEWSTWLPEHSVRPAVTGTSARAQPRTSIWNHHRRPRTVDASQAAGPPGSCTKSPAQRPCLRTQRESACGGAGLCSTWVALSPGGLSVQSDAGHACPRLP